MDVPEARQLRQDVQGTYDSNTGGGVMRISIITINGIEQEALAASAPVAVCRAMQRFGARELNGATITVR